MIIIKQPVKNSNLLGDMVLDNHLPINTPTKLELIKARELPMNTIIGFPDSADNIRVAICVLSPNSAMNIVVKVVINIDTKLFSNSFSYCFKLLFIF